MAAFSLSHIEAAIQALYHNAATSWSVGQQADQYLTAFKTSPCPYELCRTLLEAQPRSQYTQFVAISTWRAALMREWTTIELNRRHDMHTYLLTYLTQQYGTLVRRWTP